MFTQPCFIRKNTPELRKKLEELRYENRHLSMVTNVEEYPLLQVYRDGFYDGIIGDECGLEFYIDCGNNEELFFALAALRDDTPIGSWYWFNDKLIKCEELELKNLSFNTAQYLLKCRDVNNPIICFCVDEKLLRKATIKEIIEHFKDK